MGNEYVESITLNELIDKLVKYREEYPKDGDKMVYFDCLHICGKLMDQGDVLELY